MSFDATLYKNTKLKLNDLLRQIDNPSNNQAQAINKLKNLEDFKVNPVKIKKFNQNEIKPNQFSVA